MSFPATTWQRISKRDEVLKQWCSSNSVHSHGARCSRSKIGLFIIEIHWSAHDRHCLYIQLTVQWHMQVGINYQPTYSSRNTTLKVCLCRIQKSLHLALHCFMQLLQFVHLYLLLWPANPETLLLVWLRYHVEMYLVCVSP